VKRALIRCAGALVPSALQARRWDVQESVSHHGPRANLNLRIESPSHALLTSVENRAADLVRIASYVYAADQLVQRGGEADVYGDSWERDFTLCLPVNDPGFWSNPEVKQPLQDVLRFASGDRWEFHFWRAAPDDQQLSFDLEPSTTLGEPDAVHLFSGGIDSLCAVVEAVAKKGRRPLLVGHSPAFHIASRQRSLARALSQRFRPGWHFPYLSVAIHRAQSDAREYTQRTRSFLYAALGAVVADRLGLTEVTLADNGVVALNLPINDQLLGTKASRSTHPKFLRLFNEFVQMVLPSRPQLVNPLWSRTRAEGLQALKEAKVADLLQETSSCSHPRYLTAMRPHCGLCYQCIDRRFATLAAGLEEYDPAERYEVDIFRGPLSDGPSLTMAVSYERFAREVTSLEGVEMFARFPELYDCLLATDPGQRDTALALTSMLQRHGTAILQVIEEQFGRFRHELAWKQLPATGLLRLVAGPTEVEALALLARQDNFSHSEDYVHVGLREDEYTLTEPQSAVIRILNEAFLRGTPDVRWRNIAAGIATSPRSMRDVFKTVPNWRNLVVSRRRGTYRINR
jgi:7-cyano-7-deazaguanine synthase in queuosine biosynthesis